MHKRLILTLISVLTFACVAASPAAAQVPPLFAKNAASFADGLTPGIASIYRGSDRPFAPFAASAAALPLPTELLGVRVSVGGFDAPLFFVSPGQINCLIDERFAGRTVGVAVYSFNSLLYYSEYFASLSFGVFSVNARGNGLAAGLAYDPTTSAYLPLYRLTTEFGIQPIPVSAVSASGPNYLILYGTGAPLAGKSVRVFIDGLECSVAYAGAAPDLAGVQQLNVALQATFVDRGFCAVRVVVDGRDSNEVLVFFQ